MARKIEVGTVGSGNQASQRRLRITQATAGQEYETWVKAALGQKLAAPKGGPRKCRFAHLY